MSIQHLYQVRSPEDDICFGHLPYGSGMDDADPETMDGARTHRADVRRACVPQIDRILSLEASLSMVAVDWLPRSNAALRDYSKAAIDAKIAYGGTPLRVTPALAFASLLEVLQKPLFMAAVCAFFEDEHDVFADGDILGVIGDDPKDSELPGRASTSNNTMFHKLALSAATANNRNARNSTLEGKLVLGGDETTPTPMPTLNLEAWESAWLRDRDTHYLLGLGKHAARLDSEGWLEVARVLTRGPGEMTEGRGRLVGEALLGARDLLDQFDKRSVFATHVLMTAGVMQPVVSMHAGARPLVGYSSWVVQYPPFMTIERFAVFMALLKWPRVCNATGVPLLPEDPVFECRGCFVAREHALHFFAHVEEYNLARSAYFDGLFADDMSRQLLEIAQHARRFLFFQDSKISIARYLRMLWSDNSLLLPAPLQEDSACLTRAIAHKLRDQKNRLDRARSSPLRAVTTRAFQGRRFQLPYWVSIEALHAPDCLPAVVRSHATYLRLRGVLATEQERCAVVEAVDAIHPHMVASAAAASAADSGESVASAAAGSSRTHKVQRVR